MPVVCSLEAQLRLFFPSLQFEYFSWLRGLVLDQYFVLTAGAHALAPYSNVGPTAPVYTILIILELAPQCVPASNFSRANFLIPFVAISSSCGFCDRRGSIFTPRQIGVSTWGSVLSPSFRVIFSLRVAREKSVARVFILLI